MTDDKVEIGRHAARLLEDEVLAEAHEEARARIIEEWQATSDRDRQYAAWAKLHAFEAVRDELRRMVSDGECAGRGR